MKYVHHTLKHHSLGILVYIVIQYHRDEEIGTPIIDKVTVHPIDMFGVVCENILEEQEVISNGVQLEAMGLLIEAGLI